MMSSSGYQLINGLRLFVHRYRDEAAPPSGLTIVLIHGFMDSGGTWDMVAPTLARAGHDVVAPDLRGFGLSDSIGAGGYYHFPDYVADLAALIDGLAPRRLAIVGHSMGGTVAALYAGAHADRVERLALLEGTGPMASEPSIAVDRMQAWLRTMREVARTPKNLTSLQEAIERLSLHHPRVPRDIIESRAKLLTRVDDAGRLLWAYDPLHRTTAPTPFHAAAFEEFLRRIDCPTLVVGGGPTGWHPPDEPQRIACLRHAVRVELPNAGHMMHWTEPTTLAHHLAHFFGEPPRARAPVSKHAPVSHAPVSHAPVSPSQAGVAPAYAPAGASHAPAGHTRPPADVPSSGRAGAANAAGHTAPGAPSLAWVEANAPAAQQPAPASAAPVAPAPSQATPAPPVVIPAPGPSAPARPIYGGAAADLGAAPIPAGPLAGSVPAVPTQPSGGGGGPRGNSQGGG